MRRALTVVDLDGFQERSATRLSGGQQQRVALARAIVHEPRLLLLDEPSMGLAPIVVEQILEILARLKDEGITVLLVEQNARAALSIADRGYVMETGEIVRDGTARELAEDPAVKAAYLGVEAGS